MNTTDYPDVKCIYSDSACMTIRPHSVINTINSYYSKYPVCAGRSNHKLSSELSRELDVARKTISSFFGAKVSELIITRNTTEGINIISHSLKPKSIVVILDKEHNSNLVPWQVREDCELRVCPTIDGYADIDAYKKLIVGATLVSFGLTSNVDGMTQNAKELISLAHKAGAKVLIDGAQSAGHMDIDVHKLDCDYFVCSSHKMMGPSLGMLYVKEKLMSELRPLCTGGMTVSQTTVKSHMFLDGPARFEAGLQDYAGILGFAAACSHLKKIGISKIEKHTLQLNKLLTEKLLSLIGNKIKLIGPIDPKQRGAIFNFYSDIDAHDISLLLDSYSIAVRSGQHCAHAYYAEKKLPISVRISFHYYNTIEDVEKIAHAIKTVVQ